jgi:uncharacterized protein YjbI with pentapeptide repeats
MSDLVNARLRGLIAPGMIAVGSRLDGAILDCANVPGADFSDTSMKGASTYDMRAMHAVFVRAVLDGSDMRSGFYECARFEDCSMRQVDISDSAAHASKFIRVNVSGLVAHHVSFHEMLDCEGNDVDLRQSNFTGGITGRYPNGDFRKINVCHPSINDVLTRDPTIRFEGAQLPRSLLFATEPAWEQTHKRLQHLLQDLAARDGKGAIYVVKGVGPDEVDVPLTAISGAMYLLPHVDFGHHVRVVAPSNRVVAMPERATSLPTPMSVMAYMQRRFPDVSDQELRDRNLSLLAEIEIRLHQRLTQPESVLANVVAFKPLVCREVDDVNSTSLPRNPEFPSEIRLYAVEREGRCSLVCYTAGEVFAVEALDSSMTKLQQAYEIVGGRRPSALTLSPSEAERVQAALVAISHAAPPAPDVPTPASSAPLHSSTHTAAPDF